MIYDLCRVYRPLLNAINNNKHSKDIMCICTEKHTFKSKLQKGKPNVNIVIHSLNQRGVIEKYIALLLQTKRKGMRHNRYPFLIFCV